jgi:hypothetical protein
MGALSSLATVGLNLALAQQASRRQSRDINTERDRQIEEIRQRDEEARRQEEEALRRRLATQRARAAAAGVGGPGGSSEAVLRGLIEESEAALQAREELSGGRIADIRQSAQRSRQRNLLDLVGSATGSGLRTLGSRSVRRSSLLDF